jgi:PilZ domain
MSKTLASKLAEHHTDIVTALREGNGCAEQRRAQRVEDRADAEIYPCDDDGQWSAPMAVRLQDFSYRGLGFHVALPMAQGQQFIFHLPRENGGATPILCTVVYCRKGSAGEHRVGAEFTCIVQMPPAPSPAAGDLERIKHSILD